MGVFELHVTLSDTATPIVNRLGPKGPSRDCQARGSVIWDKSAINIA